MEAMLPQIDAMTFRIPDGIGGRFRKIIIYPRLMEAMLPQIDATTFRIPYGIGGRFRKI